MIVKLVSPEGPKGRRASTTKVYWPRSLFDQYKSHWLCPLNKRPVFDFTRPGFVIAIVKSGRGRGNYAIEVDLKTAKARTSVLR